MLFGFLFVTVSSRLTGEIGSSSNPISGMTVATLLLTCLDFPADRLDGSVRTTYRAVGRRHRLHRRVERRHDVAGFEDRISGRRDAEVSADRDSHRRARLRAGARTDPAEAQRRRDGLRPAVSKASAEDACGALRDVENCRRHCASTRGTLTDRETYEGKDLSRLAQAADATMARQASIWSTTSGTPVYLVDPGINGTHRATPDGERQVTKFDAPKATLMSYIIKGILDRKLPWGLVLFGVMIAIVLEMSGIPSLAFAVGVYLPLSSSSPIFIGGHGPLAGRPLRRARSTRARALTEEQLDGRRRQEPRRADGVGLHRRRRDRRHRHRVHGRRDGRFHQSNHAMVDGEQPVLRGTAGRSAVAGAIRPAGRVAVSRRTRARSCTEDTAGSPHLAQILAFDFGAGAADGRGPRRGAARP